MKQRANLESFVGKWNTTGKIIATANTSPADIKGYDTYEWLPGEFFLLHKVDVFMGPDREQSLEIIGYDETTNTYPMHFFDNHGNSGLMEGNLNDGVWTFLSPSMRFTGSFTDTGNKLSGIWEQSSDGAKWIPWMEISLIRLENA